MPITLSEALERAKSTVDDDGIISIYAYDRLLEALEDKDKHPFTLGLVDLGIHTRLASEEEMEHVARILAHSPESRESRQVSILEDFVRVAQQYMTNPFNEEDDVFVDDEFLGSDDIEYLRSVLEENGIGVNKDGLVSRYKSNIPGLFNKRIPLNAMDMDKALYMLNSEANGLDKEQSRVEDLQDIVSRASSVSDVNEVIEELGAYQYSTKSKDPLLGDIANALEDLRNSLSEKAPMDSRDLGNLHELLDEYFQRLSEKYDKLLEVIDALSRVKDLKENNPDVFSELVSGMGGVIAMFRSLVYKEESWQR